MKSNLEALVAFSSNHSIGLNNTLPWRLLADLQRFKRLTYGHSVLMGRKTFESIGRPLPGRRNWVLSRQTGLVLPGCTIISDWNVAVESLQSHEKLFLIGGADLYRQLLPHCGVLHLTRVLGDVEGDSFIEAIDTNNYRLLNSERTEVDSDNNYPTIYELWVRD